MSTNPFVYSRTYKTQNDLRFETKGVTRTALKNLTVTVYNTEENNG
jgi:hypothetical protein